MERAWRPDQNWKLTADSPALMGAAVSHPVEASPRRGQFDLEGQDQERGPGVRPTALHVGAGGARPVAVKNS